MTNDTQVLTPAQIVQCNLGFYDSVCTAALSENGDLYVACVTAAKRGNIPQVKELVRHFDNVGIYAMACKSSVNEWLEMNA